MNKFDHRGGLTSAGVTSKHVVERRDLGLDHGILPDLLGKHLAGVSPHLVLDRLQTNEL